jgi:hypothetical protein
MFVPRLLVFSSVISDHINAKILSAISICGVMVALIGGGKNRSGIMSKRWNGPQYVANHHVQI